MTKPEKYVGKHRAPGRRKAVKPARKRAMRAGIVATSVAATATGLGVAAGVFAPEIAEQPAPRMQAMVDTVSADELLAQRSQTPVSRSDRRGTVDQSKAQALSVDQGVAVARTANLSTGDPRDVARVLLREYGFEASQFDCLNSLWVSESGWRVDADNPNSSAYGIPQALTATHDMPAGYMTSAEVQIRWGLDYIKNRYGSPCSAWSFKQGRGWY